MFGGGEKGRGPRYGNRRKGGLSGDLLNKYIEMAREWFKAVDQNPQIPKHRRPAVKRNVVRELFKMMIEEDRSIHRGAGAYPDSPGLERTIDPVSTGGRRPRWGEAGPEEPAFYGRENDPELSPDED